MEKDPYYDVYKFFYDEHDLILLNEEIHDIVRTVKSSFPENETKTQTKKQSSIESLVNTVIGLITSFLIQIWIYPFLGIEVNLNQNLFITFIFFVASFLRGYLVRRMFNRF